MQRADGRSFHAGLAVGEVRYGARDCKLLIVRDLDDSERTRSALETSNRELQAMAGLFSLQEDERRAISRDLHDDIGQAITAIKLSAHAAGRARSAAPWRGPGADRQPGRHHRGQAARHLHPAAPAAAGRTGPGSGAELAGAGAVPPSPVELLAEIEPLPHRPDNSIEQACFRIAQERA
jgi:hypothetical protein